MKDKLGYMLGDLGNDFTFLLSTMILTKFYTDAMGVSAGIVGTIMMLARFVDAFTDVTMGRICDRSKPSAAGKFRPWPVCSWAWVCPWSPTIRSPWQTAPSRKFWYPLHKQQVDANVAALKAKRGE